MLGGSRSGYRPRPMAVRAALVLLLAAFALGAVACGGGEEAAPTAEEVETGAPGQGETETEAETEAETETQGQAETDNAGAATEGETDTAGETGESAAPTGNAEAGRSIYEAQGCGSCHALEEAGSTGNVGPNLDEAKPTFEEAVRQIANGGGGMPAYKDQLNEKQINDTAAFVVESSGG